MTYAKNDSELTKVIAYFGEWFSGLLFAINQKAGELDQRNFIG